MLGLVGFFKHLLKDVRNVEFSRATVGRHGARAAEKPTRFSNSVTGPTELALLSDTNVSVGFVLFPGKEPYVTVGQQRRRICSRK